MTTLSDVSSEHLQVVLSEYNKFIVEVQNEQAGPGAAAELDMVLRVAALAFLAKRAAEEFIKMFGEPSSGPGDQPDS